MQDLETERVRLETSKEDDCLVGICPNPNSLPHEYTPMETFILNGDVTLPDDWEEDIDDGKREDSKD